MIKKLLLVAFLATMLKIAAQVGIGTTSPNLTLSIKNSNTGIQHVATNKLSVVANNLNAITVDLANVGINNVNPTKILDVDANNNFLRISNLTETPNVANTLPYPIMQNPDNGETGFLDDVNVYFGSQAMRFVVNEDQNVWGNSYNYNEIPVRFKYNPQSTTPNVNGYLNFYNDIPGSSFLYSQVLSAGNGTPARTTDQIQLPKGIYRITVKLTSKFTGHDKNNSIDIKLSVNNGEYSFANGVNYGDGNEGKTGYFCETVNLNATSKVDFLYVKQTGPNTANSVSTLITNPADNVMRSIIIIERLN